MKAAYRDCQQCDIDPAAYSTLQELGTHHLNKDEIMTSYVKLLWLTLEWTSSDLLRTVHWFYGWLYDPKKDFYPELQFTSQNNDFRYMKVSSYYHSKQSLMCHSITPASRPQKSAKNKITKCLPSLSVSNLYISPVFTGLITHQPVFSTGMKTERAGQRNDEMYVG